MNTKILFAAILAVSAGCSSKENKNGMHEAVPVVDVALPVTDSLTVYREYPAQLKAAADVGVVARVSGNITGKYFKDGQYVKKGDLLFTIESTQYDDAVSKARAALETANAETEFARRQYAAMQQAIKSNAVSQMELQKSKSALDQGEAAIKNAKAALSDAMTNLNYCSVRAQGNGHISAATVDVGDFVSVTGQPLATIYDDSSLSAEFAIEETGYLNTAGNPDHAQLSHIPVTFSDTVIQPYYGTLTYVAPDVDTSTGTLTLKVKLDNKDGALKSGMYAIVHFPAEKLTDAILVKDASVGTDQQGKYLYTLNDSDKVVYTPIKTGDLYHDTLRIVTSGIDRDTRYVTKALLKVRDGMAVKPALVK